MKPIVIQEIGNQLEGLSVEKALELIDNYFSQIVWCLEKEEWNRMTDAEKRSFAETAINHTMS